MSFDQYSASLRSKSLNVFSSRPEEVQGLISGKLALRYAGRQVSSLKWRLFIDEITTYKQMLCSRFFVCHAFMFAFTHLTFFYKFWASAHL